MSNAQKYIPQVTAPAAVSITICGNNGLDVLKQLEQLGLRSEASSTVIGNVVHTPAVVTDPNPAASVDTDSQAQIEILSQKLSDAASGNDKLHAEFMSQEKKLKKADDKAADLADKLDKVKKELAAAHAEIAVLKAGGSEPAEPTPEEPTPDTAAAADTAPPENTTKPAEGRRVGRQPRVAAAPEKPTAKVLTDTEFVTIRETIENDLIDLAKLTEGANGEDVQTNVNTVMEKYGISNVADVQKDFAEEMAADVAKLIAVYFD